MIAFLDDTPTWTRILQIVLLDILLAGDNAVVIALAVRLLPPREQRLGRLWGTAGAVGLRVLFLALATWLLAIPWLQFVGGLVLLWIAYELLAPKEHGPIEPPSGPQAAPDDGEPEVAAAKSLRSAIRIIVIADASMSLDNVIAVTGAAHGHLGLAIAGIALSIPLVVWGSQILGRIMAHHRWVVWLGGGVLGHVAGVLLLEEPEIVARFGPSAHVHWHPLPVALAVGFTLFGWWASHRGRRRGTA
ncbi:MAG: TerC family protein [Planctomycetes bacterium]|nr:TerC family protein [Planctomycetota bacterium]